VLSKEFSEEAGGTNIGGYLTTALANKNGELVVPLIVTGTFEKPRFAPDLGKIAQMKLENLVPTLSNPGELTSMLGAILGKKAKNGKQDPGAEGQAGSESVLSDFLNALGGRKKKQEEKQAPPVGEPGASKQPAQPASPLEDILGTLTGKKKPAKQTPAQPPPQQQKPGEPQQPPEQPK
jgi:hypothetical protein